MAAPTEVLATGQSVTLMKDSIRRSLSNLDEGNLTYCVPTQYYFTLGDAPPTYPHMRIHDITEDHDAGDYIVQLMVKGILNGDGTKITGKRWSKTAFGFDSLTVDMIVAGILEPYQPGDSFTGQPLMFLVDQGEDDMLDNRYRSLSLKFEGIGWTKLTQRQISVNENIVSGDNIIVNLPGGWTTGRKTQASLPTIVVTDTITTTTPPPTSVIPGASTPPNPPTIQVIDVSADGLTYYWPHHWKLSAITGPELFLGAGVYQTTLTYEYQYPATF